MASNTANIKFRSFDDELKSIGSGLNALSNNRNARRSLFRSTLERVSAGSEGDPDVYITDQRARDESQAPYSWMEKAKLYFKPLYRREAEEMPSKEKVKPDPVFGGIGSNQARSKAYFHTSTG